MEHEIKRDYYLEQLIKRKDNGKEKRQHMQSQIVVCNKGKDDEGFIYNRRGLQTF